ALRARQWSRSECSCALESSFARYGCAASKQAQQGASAIVQRARRREPKSSVLFWADYYIFEVEYIPGPTRGRRAAVDSLRKYVDLARRQGRRRFCLIFSHFCLLRRRIGRSPIMRKR